MGYTDGCVEQAEIVVDLSDGADRRSRTAAGGFLLDGDCGTQSFDGIHVRTLQLVQELARVGGERLRVSALALSVNDVKRQA